MKVRALLCLIAALHTCQWLFCILAGGWYGCSRRQGASSLLAALTCTAADCPWSPCMLLPHFPCNTPACGSVDQQLNQSTCYWCACRCATAWSAARAARTRASAACSWASFTVGQRLTHTALRTALRTALVHLAVLLPAAAACAWASCTVGETLNGQPATTVVHGCLFGCLLLLCHAHGRAVRWVNTLVCFIRTGHRMWALLNRCCTCSSTPHTCPLHRRVCRRLGGVQAHPAGRVPQHTL